MFKVICIKSPFVWWFNNLEDLINFCDTFVDNSILYSIIKINN